LRPTIIATRNFFPTNLHLPKTLLSALVLSPPLGWWDISAKSTQTALYLKKVFFEKGLEVILGSSGRRVRILGVCGLGRNYVMMKVIELGGILQGEVSIQRMAVSSRPSSVWIATLHWIVSRLFKPVLGSMLDFADEEKMEDSM